jgi:hypothetical protein
MKILYIATKKFTIDGKKFKENDKIPQKYISEYLINSGKIEEEFENTNREILLTDVSSDIKVELL